MSYIILNGVNSNTIQGLIISTLPPITKPQIRTNVEVIDGRDGDITTYLGYSAYDKEIEIGLSGNYDVDEVIQYFNSSGVVTFSNEPDKYYNYEIIDQINFEKLIRFKTAKVKLHCQPFKYSTTEEKIQINATEVSGSGSSITLNNTEDGALFTSLKINGDTLQNGTPTPTSPVDVNVVSGDNTIDVCGKNLQSGLESGGINNSGNEYASSSAIRSKYYIKVQPNTTYTCSLNGTSTNANIAQYTENKTFISLTFYAGTFTTNSTTEYIRITKNGSTTDLIQLEKGSTATTYEPYKSQTYDIDLGSIELCKIGDYQDYIYKENGNWYKYGQIGKATITGNFASGGVSNVFYTTEITDYATSNNIPLSNYYSGVSNVAGASGMNSQANNTIAFINQSGLITPRFYIKDTRYTSQIDLNTWLASNPLIVYYVLATPTTTQITDDDLITQLEALIGATTYLGQTNIITSGSDLNPLLEVTTFAVDDPSFVITNSGNFKSKPIITIYGLGTIGLYLNGIQVLSLDMGETTSQITIDVAKLEAYNQETGALMNRSVTGDYNNLSLNVGENTITESGTLQGIEIENYSRWL